MANKTYRSKSSALEKAAKTAQAVVIEGPKIEQIALEIIGTAPLIQNCFNQKAVEQILRKHMGLSVLREKKKPRECVEDATIRNVRGDVCLPPTAIKKACLTASVQDKNLKKTQLRQMLFIDGQSIPIEYEKMVPRMDIVRTSGMARTPDVRFRPEFQFWKARIIVSCSDQISAQTVVDLLNRAGRVGVGEWRPEKDGQFGTFEVSRPITDKKEVQEVKKLCASPLVALQVPEWALDADIDPALLQKIAGSSGSDSDEFEADDAPRGKRAKRRGPAAAE